MLGAFRDNNPQAALVPLLQEDGSRQIQVRYRAPDDHAPGLLVGVTDVGYVFLADGCADNAMGESFFNGYLNNPNFLNRNPFNAWLDAAAGFPRALLQQTSLPLIGRPVMCGYSLGGSLMSWYAVQFAQRNGYAPQCITFGAPRAMGADNARIISGRGDNLRVMNDDDPVPLVPLRFSEAPAQALLMLPENLRSLGYYVHTSGGVSLTINGGLSASELPPIAQANPQTSLAAWLFSQDGGPIGPHSLSNYAGRITNAITLQNRANPQAPPPAPVEPVNPTTPRQESQQTRQFVQTIFNIGGRQNIAEPVVPTKQEFTAFRENSVWCVAWRGNTIAFAPTKRRARALAREGNQYLRRLQTMAYVNTDQMTGSFQGYLADATAVNSEFVPPIQNKIPT
jgi:pimeloyl-ACP methyl ester carboxylesterase